MTTLAARVEGLRPLAETARGKKREEERVNSVGLNDGDKNDELANVGKERKRDNIEARGRKTVEGVCGKRRTRGSKPRKSSLAFANVN